MTEESKKLKRETCPIKIREKRLANRRRWRTLNKDKYNKVTRDWRAKNKKRVIVYTQEKRRKNREWMIEYKKTLKCKRCDENHPACLDFHHTNGDKEFGIAWALSTKSINTIKKEIAKCEVLCANCHRKEHYESDDRRGNGGSNS